MVHLIVNIFLIDDYIHSVISIHADNKGLNCFPFS